MREMGWDSGRDDERAQEHHEGVLLINASCAKFTKGEVPTHGSIDDA